MYGNQGSTVGVYIGFGEYGAWDPGFCGLGFNGHWVKPGSIAQRRAPVLGKTFGSTCFCPLTKLSPIEAEYYRGLKYWNRVLGSFIS